MKIGAASFPISLLHDAQFCVRAYFRILFRTSHKVRLFFDARMHTVAWLWLIAFIPAVLLKLIVAPVPARSFGDIFQLFLPYFLIAIAPVLGFVIAQSSFPRDLLHSQPRFRLALFGKWQRLGPVAARDSVHFGPVGFMASLLIGMVLNVAIRSFEFMLAVPAVNSHAPDWARELFWLMALDNMAMNFFYMAAFVMALRTVPLFPRMLVFVWGLDITFQLIIARHMSASGLPAGVAEPLRDLLEGNIDKVLISAGVWLPYLLLSERVNVTYRHRAAAGI